MLNVGIHAFIAQCESFCLLHIINKVVASGMSHQFQMLRSYECYLRSGPLFLSDFSGEVMVFR